MKRLKRIWLVPGLLLIACLAMGAWDVPPAPGFALIQAGGGGDEACVETTPNSASTNNDFWYVGYNENSVYSATGYTASATGTVRTLYVDLKRIGTPDGAITAWICSTTGDGVRYSDTCYQADATVNPMDIDTAGFESMKFTFSSGVSQTSGSIYQIKLYFSGTLSSSNYVQYAANSGGTGGCMYDPDNINPFGFSDETCQRVYSIKNCLE